MFPILSILFVGWMSKREHDRAKDPDSFDAVHDPEEYYRRQELRREDLRRRADEEFSQQQRAAQRLRATGHGVYSCTKEQALDHRPSCNCGHCLDRGRRLAELKARHPNMTTKGLKRLEAETHNRQCGCSHCRRRRLEQQPPHVAACRCPTCMAR